MHAEPQSWLQPSHLLSFACRVNPGQGNDGGMLAGGTQTGGLGNTDTNATVQMPALPPGVARPPAIPGTTAYAREQVCLQPSFCHRLQQMPGLSTTVEEQ